MLCPSRDRPPHGHATTSVGSSGFSAGLVSLPDIHGLPLNDSSGDVDSKVDAHPPYPIQIGVCPQSRQTPDLGTPASQPPAVGHTRDRAATGPAAVIPHHFLDAENAFLNREEDPPHSSWASCSEPPAPMHNTNATADLSTCNGTPATFGQHNDCQDRDDTDRTRPVTPPSVPSSPNLRPPFVPLEHAYAAYGDRLHTSATMLFFSGIHCAEQFMMASKARLLAMIRRSQPPLLQMTPESKTASAVMYATLITISGSKNAKIQPSEATWQNSPRTRKCARPRAHCAHAASPKRAPMTNCGASARARATPRAQTPRQSCAPLWPRPLPKRLRTYRPARQHGDILTKI